MRFTCNKKDLSQAVLNVSRAVIQKSTVGALEGILLSARGGAVTLTGYDLEFSIKTHIEAEIFSAGEIVISARIFTDMVRKLPAEKVTIEADEKNLVNITSGSASYTILGMPSLEFPDVPTVENEDTITIPNAVLKDMINHTLFAVSQSDSKPAHMGSLFEFKDDTVTVVSVDGFRLAIRREKIKTPVEDYFIVPSKTLKEITNLFEDDGICEINAERKRIVFSSGNYTVFSRLIEGEFLNYEEAIPKKHTTSMVIDKDEIGDCLERVSLLIADRLKYPLKINIEEDTIEVRCDTPLGKANDTITCRIEGDPIKVGLNSKYILEALRATDCQMVKIRFNGPLSPVVIEPTDNDRFLFLVLPVRIK